MASHIHFFEEDIEFSITNKLKIKKWIKELALNEGFEIDTLNYIFCSDQYLLSRNIEFLNHDTLTDIITFDYSENQNVIVGDIFISIERVKENAIKFNTDFYSELCRVIIHGVLHLCGYKDKTVAQKTQMREKENQALAILKISNHQIII
jgi:rRNA maturation RNase YbeY